MEERKAESVLTRTGLNQNSLTGGDWESLMVSMEASHLAIQRGREGTAKPSLKVK